METNGSNGSKAEGNNISSASVVNDKKKRISPSLYWVFTYNNYIEDRLPGLGDLLKKKCTIVFYNKEIGESGTPHLQGYLKFKKKERPSEIFKDYQIWWQKAKGNIEENWHYCSKSVKQEEVITFIYGYKPKKELKIIKDLRPWQEKLESILLEDPDDRGIIWVYEETGNVGKSAFSKYMVVKHEALYITEGKKSDIINIVYNYVLNQDLDIMILDVPRDNGNNISYKSLEEVKNGLICNTKYETGNKVINSPNIIVFSNSPPQINKMSMDRWQIYKIKNNKLKRKDPNKLEKDLINT